MSHKFSKKIKTPCNQKCPNFEKPIKLTKYCGFVSPAVDIGGGYDY